MSLKERIPVIIDTDPGVDDTIAILLALASPELEVLAFIVSFGNTDIESSHLNILKIYQALARHFEQYPSHKYRFPNFFSENKPVLARGCRGPLEGELHSARYFHGRDGLSSITDRHPDLNIEEPREKIHPQLEVTDRPGVDVALDLIRQRPSKSITYIALGPLTTLAHMMRQDGDLVRNNIGRIVSMGGALDVPGNTSPTAEFNFFADPFAVKELLIPEDSNTALPLDRLLLLPLDITNHHQFSFSTYKDKVDPKLDIPSRPSIAADKSPLTHFTSSFLERVRERMLQFGKDSMVLHDPATVWCAIENPPSAPLRNGWKVRPRVFDIEQTGRLTRGMLVVDRREGKSAYPLGANRAEVQAELERHGSDLLVEQVLNEKPVRPGVLCVHETPGSERLMDLVLQRVWGV
ncbi:Inosine/uridine-preferring nucleoside hydrolase domain-containing protein [Collybia nuda]|uniref:Inosine/uridine-preferring nucleoside hydrolase domain-containing protein n=1 Tax=Collybia nuda TaxID=64659 RepID=A0A9P5YGM6_9AGAR|nr:Inosine/uridine-preferring nucleoside hydrolase domain-containing protein [Collybia nuda]